MFSCPNLCNKKHFYKLFWCCCNSLFPRQLKYLRVAQDVQTLPNVGQSICKMHPLCEISLTYESTVQFIYSLKGA